MKYKIAFITSIILVLLMKLTTFGQASLIIESEMPKQDGMHSFTYAPKAKTYYAIFENVIKKKNEISLVNFDENFNLLWSKKIIENYDEGKAYSYECFKLLIEDTNIKLFYTQLKGNSASEFQITFDLEGNKKGDEKELFSSEDCQLIRKIENDGNIIFIPLKYHTKSYGTPSLFLASNNELSIFILNTSENSVKKIPGNLTDEIIYKFIIKDNTFYAHVLKNTSDFMYSLDLNTGKSKETEKRTFNVANIEKFAVNEMNTYVYNPTEIVKMKYQKPTLFELSDKDLKEDAMGKIVVIKYGFDGKTSESIIEIPAEVKEKVKEYGKKIGINKYQLLQNFQVREAFEMNNKNIVFIIERKYYKDKSSGGNSIFVPMAGELLIAIVDENGKLLNINIIDRVEKIIYEESKIFFSHQGNVLKLLYPANKKVTNGGDGLHLTTISETGVITENGKADNLSSLGNYFVLDDKNSLILNDNEIVLIQRKTIKKEILYKIKL